MESDAQLVSSEFPVGVRLGSDQETYLAFHPVLLIIIATPDTFVGSIDK